MKCSVCNEEYNGKSYCPYCGMLCVVDLDGQSEIMKTMSSNYRKKIISNITAIGVVNHSYKMANQKIVKDSVKLTDIATGEQCFMNPVWTKERFAQYKGSREITLQLYVKTRSNKTSYFNFKMAMPDVKEFWKVGVMMNNDLSMNVYLGIESNCSRVRLRFLPVVSMVK